ncbi:MT-A70-domain-containing protein [Cladorrhinum sp. PSN259]|nr:MT-A70-domain-containing protein [Cladorrhinum sp. PSN259]
MTAPSSSCILWQNDDKTTILLDLPRSIEEAQLPSKEEFFKDVSPGNESRPRRLISAAPPDGPFPTPDPKLGCRSQPVASTASQSAQLAELMTLAAAESALDKINWSYQGPWCLPRVTSKPITPTEKQPVFHSDENSGSTNSTTESENTIAVSTPSGDPGLTTESSPSSSQPSSSPYYMPPDSHPLLGSIASLRSRFLSPPTPKFNLILLDPPWPNRSAKRKRRGADSYTPVDSLTSIHSLLSLIPIASSLLPDGMVAVWITNTPKFHDLLTSTLFKEWDVELVGEWVWLKVTTKGEPIVSFESEWRRPWERLVLGRKRGGMKSGAVRGKVLVGVPDFHSRKPNLRSVFEEEGLAEKGYKGLEVFARNLTAGWWGWGDEVLKFQGREWWVEEGEEVSEENVEGQLERNQGNEEAN